MLIQVKPGERPSWGHNAKKSWYLGPCLKHYRSFKGVLPSTKGERISDSVRFQHHAIAIPELTPADRILEATKQLKDAIEQQPKRPPSDELRAIELLREVMLGERSAPLPLNSIQQMNANHKKQLQKERVKANPIREDDEETVIHSNCNPNRKATKPTVEADSNNPPINYISDEEDGKPSRPRVVRHSKRILSQQEEQENPNLHRIYDLAENETATLPPLAVDQRKLTRGYHAANLSMQLDEWAYKYYFAGAIIDQDTGKNWNTET